METNLISCQELGAKFLVPLLKCFTYFQYTLLQILREQLMFYDPVTFQLFKPLASYLVANYAFVHHTSIDSEKAT